jgi:hypothetical protein
MKFFKLSRTLWTTVILGGFPLGSYATTLTDPFFQGEVSLQANGNDFDTSFSSPTNIAETRTSLDPDTPAYASTTYSMTAAPLPGLTDLTTVDGSAGSSGVIGYQFSIVGPAGEVPIAITFNGSEGISGYFPFYSTEVSVQAAVGTVIGTGPSFSDSYLVEYLGYGEYGVHTLNGVSTSITDDSFDATDSVELTANAVYGVGLQMYIEVNGNGSASAYVDPLIQIAPGFANASEYSIELSPGIGNSAVAAVPSPSTYMLMLVGLGALCIVPRRRKVSQVSQAG